jgi:hypothetical protein
MGFHIDEFMRIIKLNHQLKKSLWCKLKILLDKRSALADKNEEIAE